MRTKFIREIDFNDHYSHSLEENLKMSDDDKYKLSVDEFSGRWLALKPFCHEHEYPCLFGKSCPSDCTKSPENYMPCLHCLYYGEFETIDDYGKDAYGNWYPPIMVCTKCCDNRSCNEKVCGMH